uniref:Ankyrin repeat-containing protein n=1 Tax=Borely moumouvirus TaxID=2712067 RepID=A0A6G6ADB0_9VIRU
MILKFYYKYYNELPLGLHKIEFSDLYLLKTNITELTWFFEEYIYLVEVDLNDSETSFHKSKYNEFTCNKFNILEKYSLLDLSTLYNIGIKKVYIDPCELEDDKYINFIHVLNESNIELYFSDNFMYNASINGHTNLLNLYFIYGNKIPLYGIEIDEASARYNIKSLNWWINSGLELNYTNESFNFYQCNEIKILELLNWWIESGLEIKYNHNFIKKLSDNKCIQVLDFLLSHGFKLECNEIIIDNNSSSGRSEVLDWWLNSGIQLNYTEKSIDSAIGFRNEKILKWWINSGLKLKYTKAFILSSQEWLKEIGIFDYFIN